MVNHGNTCYLPDFPGMLSLTDFAVLPSSRPYQLHINCVTHLFLGGDGSPLLYQITTPWGRDHSPCWLNRISAALGKAHSRSNKKRSPPHVQWHRSFNPLAGVMGTAVWHKGQGHELPRISRLYDLDPSSTTASCGASGKFLHLTMPQFSPSANRDNNISLSYRNTEG